MPIFSFNMPRPHMRHWLTVVIMTLAACASTSVIATTAAIVPWQHARQMVLVTIDHWDSTQGVLRTYARSGGSWHQTGTPHPVVIGHGGAGWGLGLQATRLDGPVKKEGDGRSPAGVFHIGSAFGYAATARTALPYRAMQASNWCVDVSGSPYYNRIVDADKVGAATVKGATEPMRRDLHDHGDQRYRQGFVIKHNWQQKPMGGSCIFAHLWKSPTTPTTGCTAMAPQTMKALLAWLDPRLHPVFVLLPHAQYMRLRKTWNLPALGGHS